jgi:hypothetical protein
MRISIDETASRQIEDFARRTNRTASSAAAFLISRSFLEWGAKPLAQIEEHVVEHGNGITISARVRGDLSEGLRRYAQAESRSLSSVMKRILREKLTELGYMPTGATGNDPVEPTEPSPVLSVPISGHI